MLCLYHYFEKSFGPFMSLTALPIEEAREILTYQKSIGKFGNPDIEEFLLKRYKRDEQLCDMFIGRGGHIQMKNPAYLFLGEHRQWESAYENPAVIKIPLSELDPLTVSFTYGDSFAVLNPDLFGAEEYWNKVYFMDEILDVVERHGFPPHVEYDFKLGIYPADKHINNHLKYVEAHIWNNEVLEQYRTKWLNDNPAV